MGVNISHHTITANGIKQHFVEAGAGNPVVLLHGFPETWYAWRKQIPVLGSQYRLIIPDLRGYGATEKPTSGYDKRTMANDILALMRQLDIEHCPIIGHDRGARVATRFAKDHPDDITRLAVLDNIPTRIIFDRMDAKIARGHWFFLFNAVRDLPEALITGREELWLRYIFASWTYDPEVLTPDDIAVYTRAYAQHGALRGALEDYRAAAEDVAQDEQDARPRSLVRPWHYGARISLPAAKCGILRRFGAAWQMISNLLLSRNAAIFPTRSALRKFMGFCWSF